MKGWLYILNYWMDFKMCMTLQRINGMSPEEILNNYWEENRDSYPIDISKILYNMGIRVHAVDFSDFFDENGKILGAMIADKNNLALLYREGETKNRSRFTLAHELGHCCLMHINEAQIPYVEYRHDGEITDKKEIEANIFAGEILIPEKELYNVLISKFPNEIPVSQELARVFAVSNNVMRERLKWLKVPFIDEYGRKIFCVE